MSDFDSYLNQTLEQSKRLLEKAKVEKGELARQAYFKASYLFAFTFLEGQLNSIADDFNDAEGISLLDQSVLKEKDLSLVNGKFTLGRDKYFRTDERIEFFHQRFGNCPVDKNLEWWSGLKRCVLVRNKLVHPRKKISLKSEDCEDAIQHSLSAVNAVFLIVYKKAYPLYNLNLDSQLEF